MYRFASCLGVAVLVVLPLVSARAMFNMESDEEEPILKEEGEVLGNEEDTVLVLGANEETEAQDHSRHLNLEDPVEWSESGEVLDSNHAWYEKDVDQ